ncbi:MAG: methyltransferase domain-containing protein [Planctomycetes bacterium]|nr:methyltransferase domain-containing protein [Planctomycetota bacterium]
MGEAPSTPSSVATTNATPTPQNGTLFLISVIGLFLELLLIRWVSTEIRIFAYLQNTVLVVCFLGLGMGCWDSRKPFTLRSMLVPLILLTALLAVPTTRVFLGDSITELLGQIGGMELWDGDATSDWPVVAIGILGLSLAAGLLYLLWATFVPVGRLLGRLMADDPRPLRAYSVNIVGSLIGIWLFVACSALGLPPVAWFLVFAVGAAFLLGSGGKSKLVDAGLLAGIVGLGILAGTEPGWPETHWSPYQKLTLLPVDHVPEATIWRKLRGERFPGIQGNGTHFIGVNNVGYQSTIDLSRENVAAHPEKFDPKPDKAGKMPTDQHGFSQYDLPAKLHSHPRSMLIVGAGSGNDVAGALRNGVESVTAVEIDPVIIDIGRRVHPEKPYSDPRVTVVNDDARSFFATTDQKFDVIAFGLLDSHTSGSAMANTRLDHYVYTRESLTHAKSLLKPGGVVVLSFLAYKPHIADRMVRALTEVFGEKPLVFYVPYNAYGWGGLVCVAGDLPEARKQIAADPKFTALIHEWEAGLPFELPGTTEVPTDDWPYLYLEHRQIPPLYFLLCIALVGLFIVGLKRLDSPQILRGWDRTQTHFAMLGAGFMLLEVQNISKAAVVLGNTWVVNAVIISGVLFMILLANVLSGWAKRWPIWPVYVALVGSCLGLYFVDLSRFAFLPYATKAIVVGLLTSLPMLFSGLVFARSWEAAERKDAALGANLFGALLGAMLQSVTFVIGVKALLLIVAGFYLLAVLTRPKPNPLSTGTV